MCVQAEGHKTPEGRCTGTSCGGLMAHPAVDYWPDPVDQPFCIYLNLLLAPLAGTTMWRFTTAETSPLPCWGSSAGRSRHRRSSPAAASSSSSSSPTTRLTGPGSPCATRSSKQVRVRLWFRHVAIQIVLL